MTEEMMFKKEMELRYLAEMVVKSPEATAIISSIFYDNAKHGVRRVGEEAHRTINDISEEDEKDIPIEVLRFLKKTKNIHPFFEIVRKLIVNKLLSERLFDEQIVKYVDCFDCKMLKKYLDGIRVKKNLKKFVIMVCLDDSNIYYDDDPVTYMKLVKKLYSLDLDDHSVLQATELLTSFYAPKKEQ